MVSIHAPEALRITSELPKKAVRGLGSAILLAVERTRTLPQISKLEFNGVHALQPYDSAQLTTVEIGATAIRPPRLHSRHSIEEGSHLTPAPQLIEEVEPRFYAPVYTLFTHNKRDVTNYINSAYKR